MISKQSGIRLSRLEITNYKKIDSLVIDFPRPEMPGDPDILVFGSKNGGGKTSVLECCSILALAGILGERFKILSREDFLDFANVLIKAGQQEAIIKGCFEINKKTISIVIKLNKNTGFSLAENDEKGVFKYFNRNSKKIYHSDPEHILNSVFAFSSEPLIILPLLHFNSYRKIQESNPELGMMADDYPVRMIRHSSSRMEIRRNISTPVSSFKLEILRSLMGRAALFEGFNLKESEEVLSQLNRLIERYCGGQIENLRPLPDNKVDIRIQPVTGGDSFSFDGLSSGQKEMIATLFLIWKNTQEQPGIVLIDEPELHLNAEWHSDFIQQLYRLAPHNQYILATHSREIFRSVDKYQRAILMPDNGESI